MIITTSRIESVFMAGTSYIDRLAQYDEATPGLKGVGYHQKEGGAAAITGRVYKLTTGGENNT